jgi:hypothetical protein
VNATATTYTAAQGFAALEAIKSAKAKYDAIAYREAVGGFRHCPDAAVAAAYHEAGQKLFEVADYFFATLTGFKTLNECLDAQEHGYRPSFYEAFGKDLETVFLAEVYDYLAETRGLPQRAYRPQRAKPTKLTVAAIKAKLRDLREEAHRNTRSIDAKYFRSSGIEVRLGGGPNDYYEYGGAWDGTLKDLRDHAERCRSNGGDTVTLGGQWLFGNDLKDTFDPTDCEWFVELKVDEILSIGKKAVS